MSYNAKNYTEQGGEKTVIGGSLEIKEGAIITGLPCSVNQDSSTATTVSGVKNDLNQLLKNLKDAGLMERDTWSVSVAEAPTLSDPTLVANHEKVESITIEGNRITVLASVSEMTAFPSSNPAQGTHAWIAMLISTGLEDITTAKYNNYQLTSEDVAEAAAHGGSAGDILMWLKCDEILVAEKVFTLWSSGYPLAEFCVTAVEPEEESAE